MKYPLMEVPSQHHGCEYKPVRVQISKVDLLNLQQIECSVEWFYPFAYHFCMFICQFCIVHMSGYSWSSCYIIDVKVATHKVSLLTFLPSQLRVSETFGLILVADMCAEEDRGIKFTVTSLILFANAPVLLISISSETAPADTP
jgi:hypothetical protein